MFQILFYANGAVDGDSIGLYLSAEVRRNAFEVH